MSTLFEIEGSRNPEEFGKINMKSSSLTPPDLFLICSYMEELFDFINKIYLAHYKFTWIHPFDNRNGRILRLLTYAMLLKCGFIKKLNREY